MTALDNARIALNKADLAECLPECVPVLVISAFANYKEAEAALAYLVANAKAEIEHESVKAALTLVGDALAKTKEVLDKKAMSDAAFFTKAALAEKAEVEEAEVDEDEDEEAEVDEDDVDVDDADIDIDIDIDIFGSLDKVSSAMETARAALAKAEEALAALNASNAS